MKKPPHKTWIIVCTVKDAESYVFDKREGLYHVPRYKTQAALESANEWMRAKHNHGKYAAKLVRKADVNAWEDELNTPSRRKHAADVRKAEDAMSREATERLKKLAKS